MKPLSFLLAFTLLLLTGCATEPENSEENQTVVTVDNSKSIVASFYPLAYMAQEIVGNTTTVVNLAGASDVHDFEPSPQDLVRLNKADLVIFQGAELEPWAEGVIEDLESKNVMTLEVTHDLALAKLEDHDEDHGDEEDHEGEEDEEHDDHGHGEFDPHTWLDPVLAQDMVDEILAALIEIDAGNQALYKSNAETLKQKFAQLDQNFKTRLANCTNQEVIISHDAFGYIARRYGFETHAIAGISTSDEPSAKILAELKDEAAAGATHILTEQSNVTRFAETLAREAGLTILDVNPLGRGPLNENINFIDVMYNNLESFSTALNCKA